MRTPVVHGPCECFTQIAQRQSLIGANALDILAGRFFGFAYYGIKAAGYTAILTKSGFTTIVRGADRRFDIHIDRVPATLANHA
jgi:hypothetical protein